jgi:hypothetical protein
MKKSETSIIMVNYRDVIFIKSIVFVIKTEPMNVSRIQSETFYESYVSFLFVFHFKFLFSPTMENVMLRIVTAILGCRRWRRNHCWFTKIPKYHVYPDEVSLIRR